MNPLLLNPFVQTAFSMTAMTAAINSMPFVPTRARGLGIFASEGISTTNLMVEEQSGRLTLVQVTERGAPPVQMKGPKRKVRSLVVPHLQTEDTVMATEIQNVRAFGGGELQGLEQTRNNKMAAMTQAHDLTLEYGSLGAIKGVITDSDGSTVLYDLFDVFGITQEEVDFELDDANTEVKLKCLAVQRLIEDALGAAVYTGIHCFCGPAFMDKLTTHPKVKEAYDRWQSGQFFREDQRKGFLFCGITFEEYRGSVNGVDFVDADEAHFFPLGVPGAFRTWFAPGNFVEAANTVGLPRYAKSEPMDYDRGLKMLVESNPISICTVPAALIKGIKY